MLDFLFGRREPELAGLHPMTMANLRPTLLDYKAGKLNERQGAELNDWLRKANLSYLLERSIPPIAA